MTATARDPRETVRLLLSAGERLPDAVRRRILALGPAAVAPLIAMLEDAALAAADAPGEGYAPIHAADLLGALRAEAAIEPMLRVLGQTDWTTILHDRLLTTLPLLGAAVLEPALRAYGESDDPEYLASLRAVLAGIGVKDERIFERLVGGLPQDLTIGAGNLAEYGDPRAIPHLARALDALEVDPEPTLLANHEVFEIEAAIEALGGVLTPSQAEKCRRAHEVADRTRDALRTLMAEADDGEMEDEAGGAGAPTRRSDRPGRNDPCWCGSGAKYKKCHLREDDG